LIEQSEDVDMDQFLASGRISKEVEQADDERDGASNSRR
jgi:hypothetical protein